MLNLLRTPSTQTVIVGFALSITSMLCIVHWSFLSDVRVRQTAIETFPLGTGHILEFIVQQTNRLINSSLLNAMPFVGLLRSLPIPLAAVIINVPMWFYLIYSAINIYHQLNFPVLLTPSKTGYRHRDGRGSVSSSGGSGSVSSRQSRGSMDGGVGSGGKQWASREEIDHVNSPLKQSPPWDSDSSSSADGVRKNLSFSEINSADLSGMSMDGSSGGINGEEEVPFGGYRSPKKQKEEGAGDVEDRFDVDESVMLFADGYGIRTPSVRTLAKGNKQQRVLVTPSNFKLADGVDPMHGPGLGLAGLDGKTQADHVIMSPKTFYW